MADNTSRIAKVGAHLIIEDDGIFVTKVGAYAEILGEDVRVTSSGGIAEIQGGAIRVTSSGAIAEVLYSPVEETVAIAAKQILGSGILSRLPDEVVGYALDPGSSFWSIVYPEPTENYCTNPSFESTDPNNYLSHSYFSMLANILWEGPNPSPSRGVRCIRLTPTASTRCTMHFIWTATEGEWTFSVDVFGAIDQKIELEIYNGSIVIGRTYYTIKQQTWERISVTAMRLGTGSTTARLIIPDTNDGSYVYTDGWQIEKKAYATSYADGSMIGHKDTPPDRSYFWQGEPNLSISSRTIGDPLGGRLISFTDEVNFLTTSIVGLGQPEPDIQEATLGSQNRTVHITSYDQPRDFTISGKIYGCEFVALMRMRQALIELLRADRTVNRDQFILQYRLISDREEEIGIPLEIACVYQNGMGGNITNFHQESVGIQFRAANPRLTEKFHLSQELTVNQTWSNNGMGLRDEFGTWQQLGTGATANSNAIAGPAVRDVAWVRNPNLGSGDLVPVAGGWFTALCGDAATNLAYWDGTNWNGIGAATQPVYVLLPTFNAPGSGRCYIGGYANGWLHYWNSGGGVTAMGTDVATVPATKTVEAMVEGSDGWVYIGGHFTTNVATTTTWNYILQYNPVTNIGYQFILAGPTYGLNGAVYDMCISPDNYLWITGTFTQDAAGNPMDGVCRVDLNEVYTARTFEQISTDTLTVGYHISCNPLDGSIYIGGTWADTSDWALKRWNGVTWEQVGPYYEDTNPTYPAPVITHSPEGWAYSWNDNEVITPLNYYDQEVPHVQPNWYTLSNINQFGPVDFIMDANDTGGDQSWPQAISFHPDGSILAAFSADGSTNPPVSDDRAATVTGTYATLVENPGSAYAHPRFKIEGPCDLVGLFNKTTGSELWFNHYDVNVHIADNEILYVDFTEARMRLWTDRRESVVGGIFLGSTSTAKFWLQPGDNYIGVLLDNVDAGTKAYIFWKPTHWSGDYVAI